MTAKENTIQTVANLARLGFETMEIAQLIKIERTLQRWGELECGNSNDHCSWSIERDETTGKPFRCVYPYQGESYKEPIADREGAALKRLNGIMEKHPELVAYHQGDPRGCALYIVRKSDLNGHELASCYNRGVAVAA